MITYKELKQAAAKAAIQYLPKNEVIGIGTGSTTNYFIDQLNKTKAYMKIKGAVASSEATASKLRFYNIPIFDLNEIDTISVYIDSADEITPLGAMIKGGGAALTREKIIASVAKQFICIADSSKLVDVLGKFPLPIEVIPIATNVVIRKLSMLDNCQPRLRMKNNKPLITINGCYIIDIIGLNITAPIELETIINNITGVVTVGLFAHKSANICLLSTNIGVKKLIF